MIFFYNISIHLFYFLALLASPFNKKAKKWIVGRKNLLKKIKTDFNPKIKSKIIWIHVSSLGEFEQGRPLIEKIKKNNNETIIVLTFFSPSGYEIRKNYELADYVFYLPNDTKRNAREFIKIINPDIVFFVKYDIWFNYLNELKRQKIKSYLISANFRKNQIFFKSYGKWYASVLKIFDIIFVQTKESQKLLQQIGINNSIITGDTRFDRVAEIAKNASENKLVEEFTRNKFTIIAGSSWQPDEEIILELLNKFPEIKLVIAPHEIHKQNIQRVKKLFKQHSPVLYSEKNTEGNVLIIDNIGLLSSIYKYADVAYVGGGFGKGIHNILEPAAHGNTVIFGNNYKKFPEAVDMISKGICFSVNNSDELIKIVSNFINDEAYLKNMSKQVFDYVNSNIGSTNKILEEIKL